MFDQVQPSFFAIQIEGQAAEQLAELLSPSVAMDIKLVGVVSETMPSDMHAINEMCRTVAELRKRIDGDTEVSDEFNPLFLPKADELLEAQLDIDARSDGVRFLGMDGNPFVIRKIEVSLNGHKIIDARCGVEQFKLPAYAELMAERQLFQLN